MTLIDQSAKLQKNFGERTKEFPIISITLGQILAVARRVRDKLVSQSSAEINILADWLISN